MPPDLCSRTSFPFNYQNFFRTSLDTLKEDGRYRVFLDLERACGHFPQASYRKSGRTKPVTVWCGNDYLGMGQHPKVLAAMHAVLDQMGAGSGGSRNISGTSPYHAELEQELAHLHDQEAALVFSSGYVANETTLQTLGSLLPNCVIFSDAQNHASLIHGIRNSRAEKHIFRHNDPQDLKRLLHQAEKSRPKVIVIESIYSMEGDIAPLETFCDLAEEFNALLFVDEVHGVGMYGAKGGGIAQLLGLSSRVDILQGTLGKAFGVMGGYIAGKADVVDYVRSFSSGFIFTTSLPPTLVAGALASLRHLKTSALERENHQANVHSLKTQLSAAGIPYMKSDSHIVPVVIGDAYLCKQVANKLLEQYGIYVQPINYPTVPRGTERLRFTPSALHTKEMIQDLVGALEEIWGIHKLKRVA